MPVTERIGFKKMVTRNPDGKVVSVEGGEVTRVYEETAAPRRKGKDRPRAWTEFNYPEGTIESLKPLMKRLAQVVNGDEGYWLEIDDGAVMEAGKACSEIIEANRDKKGKGVLTYQTIAEAVLATDQELAESKIFGRVDEVGYSSIRSQLAGEIHEEYRQWYRNNRAS